MTDPTQRHHDGLENNQIRDFLAEELRDSDVMTGAYSSPEVRQMLVKNLENARKRLESFDKGKAFGTILDQFGWREFDVSDHVIYNQETYRCFIGDDEEFKKVYDLDPEKHK